MTFTSKYNLELIPVGHTKFYDMDDPAEIKRIRRSATNFNARSDMYFRTTTKGGVLQITRVK